MFIALLLAHSLAAHGHVIASTISLVLVLTTIIRWPLGPFHNFLSLRSQLGERIEPRTKASIPNLFFALCFCLAAARLFSIPIFVGSDHESLSNSFFVRAITLPAIEELVFRGLLLTWCLRRLSPGKAILLSSVFFGALHGNAFIGATLFSFVMTSALLQSRTLWIPILLHVLNNIFSDFLPADSSRILLISLLIVGLPSMVTTCRMLWPRHRM